MAFRRCPFLLLMRLILNMMVSVTSSGIQSVAQVRFDPPYIHDLIAGTNKTVKVAVDVDTNRQEFAKIPPEKPFAVILKLEVVSLNNFAFQYFTFLPKF